MAKHYRIHVYDSDSAMEDEKHSPKIAVVKVRSLSPFAIDCITGERFFILDDHNDELENDYHSNNEINLSEEYGDEISTRKYVKRNELIKENRATFEDILDYFNNFDDFESFYDYASQEKTLSQKIKEKFKKR